MGNGPPRDAQLVVDALGVIVQRQFRADLYDELMIGLHPALGAASYPVLSGVARRGPITTSDLAREIGLDRSVVSRRAAALVEAGLLLATPDPEDSRATLVLLTGTGATVVEKSGRRLVAAVDRQLADWSSTDRQRFAELLQRFVASGRLGRA